MGIYISGVKGLPEQVQENKDNIKNIQEDISDYDSVKAQVESNRVDIGDLEDKTQDITRQGSQLYIDTASVCLNADLTFESDASNDIILNNDLDTKIVSNDNSNAYVGFDSANQFYVSSDGAIYEFSEDTIKVNSTPIGTKLYQHNIKFALGGSKIAFSIINSSSSAFTDGYEIAAYLNNKGYNATNFLEASGYYDNSQVFGVNAASSSTLRALYHNGSSELNAVITGSDSAWS